MQYVCLPEETTRRVSFYLALEEYMAGRAVADDCLFYWQVEPSVIFGRNQLMANEVNLGYCRSHGIGVYRRKSGGGCVYADKGNVMFSFITRDENVALTFNRYINMMVLVLRRLGVKAAATGRNDIMVDGRKVSGNAFYHLPGRSIVHGTMLYDTDMEHMTAAITPPGDKLKSKGVDSVRQHVALLKDYLDISLDDFKTYVRRTLCNGEYRLTPQDVSRIETIEREVYLAESFISGKDPRHTIIRRRRIEGVGGIEAHIGMKGGVIKSVSLSGDFFATADTQALLKPLCGVKLDRRAIADALPCRTESIIMNLSTDNFISLLTDDN